MCCSTSKHRLTKAKPYKHSVLPTEASTTADTVSDLTVSAQSVKEPQVSEDEICGSGIHDWKTGRKTEEKL